MPAKNYIYRIKNCFHFVRTIAFSHIGNSIDELKKKVSYKTNFM